MNSEKMYLTEVLVSIGACEEAIAWARERQDAPGGLEAAWEACPRGDWMLWLVRRVLAADARTLCMIACDCAERALRIYEAQNPGDPRPRRAVEVARECALGRAGAVDAVYAHDIALNARDAAAADAAGRAYGVYAAAYFAAAAARSASGAARAALDSTFAAASDGAHAAAADAAEACAYAARAAAAPADADYATLVAREAELAAQADVVRRYVTWQAVACALERILWGQGGAGRVSAAPPRRRGRPPLPPGESRARETAAKVRLSADELAGYRAAHDALGLTMSGTARERWDEVLERARREGLMRRQRRGEG